MGVGILVLAGLTVGYVVGVWTTLMVVRQSQAAFENPVSAPLSPARVTIRREPSAVWRRL